MRCCVGKTAHFQEIDGVHNTVHYTCNKMNSCRLLLLFSLLYIVYLYTEYTVLFLQTPALFWYMDSDHLLSTVYYSGFHITYPLCLCLHNMGTQPSGLTPREGMITGCVHYSSAVLEYVVKVFHFHD